MSIETPLIGDVPVNEKNKSSLEKKDAEYIIWLVLMYIMLAADDSQKAKENKEGEKATTTNSATPDNNKSSSEEGSRGSPPENKTGSFDFGLKNNGSNNKLNMVSSFKLWGLGILSFLIPVIYFLQANELKRKEIETKDTRHRADSLDLVLKFYKDSSLTAQRLVAYENYKKVIDELKFVPSFGSEKKDPIIIDQSLIARALTEISNSINSLARKIQTPVSGTPTPPDSYITKGVFDKEVGDIKELIRAIDNKIPALAGKIKKSDSLMLALDFYIEQLELGRAEINDALKNITSLDSARLGSLFTPNGRIRAFQRNITNNKKVLEDLLNEVDVILKRLKGFK